MKLELILNISYSVSTFYVFIWTSDVLAIEKNMYC